MGPAGPPRQLPMGPPRQLPMGPAGPPAPTPLIGPLSPTKRELVDVLENIKATSERGGDVEDLINDALLLFPNNKYLQDAKYLSGFKSKKAVRESINESLQDIETQTIAQPIKARAKRFQEAEQDITLARAKGDSI